MNSTAIIVQARLGSTRLPGKVMRMLAGKTVIQRVIEACKRANVGPVYVAVPDIPESHPLANEIIRCGAFYVGGPEGDVLGRYVIAAKAAQAEHIIRVTGDCPLIDYRTIDDVARWKGNQFYYGRTNSPDGSDCERFHWGVLLMANEMATPSEREHVTTWMRRRYDHQDVPSDPTTKFSIDTEEDFARCEMLLATVGEGARWQDYVAKLKETA